MKVVFKHKKEKEKDSRFVWINTKKYGKHNYRKKSLIKYPFFR